MATYPTKLAEAFATKAIEIYYQEAVSEKVTNQDYEGEIKDKSSILNVLTFGKILSHTYTGSNLTADDLTESNGQLKTDQATAFYFRVKSYDKFRSYIKNPEGTILAQTGRELKKVIDTFVLGLYGKVQAGQRLGTNYTTGTVTVTNTTGAVVGSGTTFTAGMVGRGFKATGHTAWYRVATFTDTTHITIVDDLDDVAAQYTGGDISAGAAYVIEANTPVQVTKSSIYDWFNQMSVMLDKAEVPAENRWAGIPPDIELVIKEAPEFIPSGSEVARNEVVLRGLVGRFANFDIYKTVRAAGDNTAGYHVMAGHKSAITFAMGFVENGMEDLIGNFGKAYKSLNVYGAKVVDERRKALTELFCTK